MEIEYTINEFEKTHVMDAYHVKTEQSEQLDQAVMQLTTIKQQCQDEA